MGTLIGGSIAYLLLKRLAVTGMLRKIQDSLNGSDEAVKAEENNSQNDSKDISDSNANKAV